MLQSLLNNNTWVQNPRRRLLSIILWYYQWICVEKKNGYVFDLMWHHLMYFRLYHIFDKVRVDSLFLKLTRPVAIIYIWNPSQWRDFCLPSWETRKDRLGVKTSREEWDCIPISSRICSSMSLPLKATEITW